MISLGARRFRVVVDAGNGAGGPTAVALYRRLGFDVVPLYCELDGAFPNHHPDPTQPENLADLIATVARERAELGIALDGDADRLIVVDESAPTCSMASEISAVVAEDWETCRVLRAPVRRVCTAAVPIPFSPPLEDFVLPDQQNIADAIRQSLGYVK